MNRHILEFKGVTSYYIEPEFPAIQNVSLFLNNEEIVALIGPNGAGKSTVLKTVFSLAKVSSGIIYLDNVDITNISANQLAKKSIAYVYQGRRLFPSLTVKENLEMGAYSRSDKSEIKKDIEKVFDLFVELRELKNRFAGQISGGEQQMVAIGRALMLRPKVLFVDEPSIGLSPIVAEKIASILKRISRDGVSILLVEQNVELALEIADRGYLMKDGKIEKEDTAEGLKKQLDLKVYFGGYDYV